MKRLAKLAAIGAALLFPTPVLAGEKHFCQGFATYADASNFGDSLPTAQERNSCVITYNPVFLTESDQTSDALWYVRCLGSSISITSNCGHVDPITPLTDSSADQSYSSPEGR